MGTSQIIECDAIRVIHNHTTTRTPRPLRRGLDGEVGGIRTHDPPRRRLSRFALSDVTRNARARVESAMRAHEPFDYRRLTSGHTFRNYI